QQISVPAGQSTRRLDRDKWQMAGRRLPGAPAATLRSRAIRQKLQMRAARSSAQVATSTGGAWVSLGPSPLPSDASGIGLQDYNWGSGRATTVAIDPNDVTGNTVYAGGAYGGVWKSTNAGNLSPSPVSVNWAPIHQPTLAIG